MNKQIKEQWLAALKSGEYKKGTSVLRNVNNEYCCLGVLCDIQGVQCILLNPENKLARYGYVDRKFDIGETPKEYDETNPFFVSYPPSSFCVEMEIEHFILELSNINDCTSTFKEVIEFIEENL